MNQSDSRVRIVKTPNPDAYMFHVSETLIPSGTREYHQGADTSDSPLAESLLNLENVELVLIASRFITVRKLSDKEWDPLSDAIFGCIINFLDSGEMAVFEQQLEADVPTNLSEVEIKILEILDTEVRPAIAQDGGDLIYHGFEDGIVHLELIGACGTCPSSTATLKYGIQNLLIEEIPQVRGVEQV